MARLFDVVPDDLHRSLAADQVHDERYDSEDDQHMNKEAADVHDEEPAEPKYQEHDCENKEHQILLSESLKMVATGANCYKP